MKADRIGVFATALICAFAAGAWVAVAALAVQLVGRLTGLPVP